jgi:hypothetical protein
LGRSLQDTTHHNHSWPGHKHQTCFKNSQSKKKKKKKDWWYGLSAYLTKHKGLSSNPSILRAKQNKKNPKPQNLVSFPEISIYRFLFNYQKMYKIC